MYLLMLVYVLWVVAYFNGYNCYFLFIMYFYHYEIYIILVLKHKYEYSILAFADSFVFFKN